MKVLLINGSPHKNGCTFTALSEIAKTLQECGVDSEIFHIGAAPIRGCMGCGGCAGKGKCIYEDTVNTAIEKAAEADGFIFGSPVHYASAGGGITSFLDRMFYAGKSSMVYKPGAAVASCRRAGSTATLDQLNKYFTISNMPLVGCLLYTSNLAEVLRKTILQIKKTKMHTDSEKNDLYMKHVSLVDNFFLKLLNNWFETPESIYEMMTDLDITVSGTYYTCVYLGIPSFTDTASPLPKTAAALTNLCNLITGLCKNYCPCYVCLLYTSRCV